MTGNTDQSVSAAAGDERTGLDAAALARAVKNHLRDSVGRLAALATPHDPTDEPAGGKRLRLAQQYFFVSCSLQDMPQILALDGGFVRGARALGD